MRNTLILIVLLSLFTISRGNNFFRSGVDPTDLQKVTAHIEADIAKKMIEDGIAPDATVIEKNMSEGKLVISVGAAIVTSVPVYEKDFIFGDLNGDGQEDIIAPVYSEFGASGSATDYYVFVYQNNTLFFFQKFSSYNLGDAVKGALGEKANFQLTEIKDGSLLGRSDVWLNEDANCCPSIHYVALISISNGIKLIEKAQVKE
jgi:hypothetical protein